LGDEAESVFQMLLRNGKDWDYVNCDREKLGLVHEDLENQLAFIFSSVVEEFEAENTTIHQIKVQRVKAIFDRRILQDEQRLNTLRRAQRDPRLIHATEVRIEKTKETKMQRIYDLKEKAKVDIEPAEVAAGIFVVEHF